MLPNNLTTKIISYLRTNPGYPSTKLLAKKTGIAHGTILHQTKWLASEGLIKITTYEIQRQKIHTYSLTEAGQQFYKSLAEPPKLLLAWKYSMPRTLATLIQQATMKGGDLQ